MVLKPDSELLEFLDPNNTLEDLVFAKPPKKFRKLSELCSLIDGSIPRAEKICQRSLTEYLSLLSKLLTSTRDKDLSIRRYEALFLIDSLLNRIEADQSILVAKKWVNVISALIEDFLQYLRLVDEIGWNLIPLFNVGFMVREIWNVKSSQSEELPSSENNRIVEQILREVRIRTESVRYAKLLPAIRDEVIQDK